MKTIGLLGGMSWESTLPYYRLINEAVRERLGGLHSARLVLHSIDFAELAALQARQDWDAAARMLGDAARGLRHAGAECVAICTNTMHVIADEVQAACGLPLLHIADATAAAIRTRGLSRVALLGTRFTMEGEFYSRRLRELHDVDVIIPDDTGRAEVHRVIYEELCRGVVSEHSRAAYQRIIGQLAALGAQGVVLGCTEIPLLLRQEDVALPLFDTGALHAREIAAWALD